MKRVRGICDENGEDLDRLCGLVAGYIEANPTLRDQPTQDMWSYREPVDGFDCEDVEL